MTGSSTDAPGEQVLPGQRCTACDYVMLGGRPRCPVCTGPLEDTVFPGRGTVWSSTVVRVALHGFPDVRVLAYVDVDEGPRLLGRVADLDAAPTPGTRVTAVDVDTVPPTFEVLR